MAYSYINLLRRNYSVEDFARSLFPLDNISPIFSLKPNCRNTWNLSEGIGAAAYTMSSTGQYTAVCPSDLLINATYFDGDTFVQLPMFKSDGGKVEIQFSLSAHKDDSNYLIDGRSSSNSRGGAILITPSGALTFVGYENIVVNGVSYASGQLTIVENKVYTVSFTLGTDEEINRVGNFSGKDTSQYCFQGYIANLKLYTNASDTVPAHWYKMNTIEMIDSINPDSEQPNLAVDILETAGTSTFENIGDKIKVQFETGGADSLGFNTTKTLSDITKYAVSIDVFDWIKGTLKVKLLTNNEAGFSIRGNGTVKTVVTSGTGGFNGISTSTNSSAYLSFNNLVLVETFTGTYTGTPVIRSLDSGTILTSDIDEPRFEAKGGLLEGEATNECKWNTDLTDSSWDQEGITLVSSKLAPDSTYRAVEIIQDTSNSRHSIHRNSTSLNTGNYSVYVKSTGQRWVLLTSHSSSAPDARGAYFDIIDGVTGFKNSNMLTSVTLENNGYYRISIHNPPASSSIFTVMLTNGGGEGDDGSYLGDGVSGCIIAFPQSEDLPFPTSPIYTESSAVTRTSSNLTYDAVGNFNPALFTIECEFSILGLNTTNTAIVNIGSSTNAREAIKIGFISSGILFILYRNSATTTFTTSLSVTPNTTHKVTIIGGFGRDTTTITLDGVTETFGENSLVPPVIEQIQVGNLLGYEVLSGHIKSLEIYDYDVTNPPLRSDLHTWTPNYSGAEYGELDSPWIPSGDNWEIQTTFLMRIYDGGSRAQAVWDTRRKFFPEDPFFLNKTSNSLSLKFGNGGDDPRNTLVNGDNFVTISKKPSDPNDGNVTPIQLSVIGNLGNVNQFLDGQITLLKLIDNDDTSNSIIINSPIRQNTMPADARIINALTRKQIGSYTLNANQPYVPELRGGGLFRESVSDKFEAYNGDVTVNDYINGVRMRRISWNATTGKEGSWKVGTGGIQADDLCISNNGSRFTVFRDSLGPNVVDWQASTEVGSEADIFSGFGYPNIFRVIKPTDTSGEYLYYQNGGAYPWTLESTLDWAFGYNGTDSYGELDNTWSATSAGSYIEIVYYSKTENSTVQLWDGRDSSSPANRLRKDNASSTLTMVDSDNQLSVDGVNVNNASFVVFDNNIYTIRLTNRANDNLEFKSLMASYNGTFFAKGQVTKVVLFDSGDASNSITINNVISSATKPTDFNIRNALLPDVGSELVTNGDFSNGVTGWSTVANNTITAVPGGVEIARDGNLNDQCFQTINTVIGEKYLVKFNFFAATGSSRCYALINGSFIDGTLDTSELGVYELFFVAQTNTAEFNIGVGGGTAGTISVGDISIKQTNIIGEYYNGEYEVMETE